MTWVLILSPRRIADRPAYPAVLGGYPTKAAAEHAGKYATILRYQLESDGQLEKWKEAHPNSHYLLEDDWTHPPGNWETFSVIPGVDEQPTNGASE